VWEKIKEKQVELESENSEDVSVGPGYCICISYCIVLWDNVTIDCRGRSLE